MEKHILPLHWWVQVSKKLTQHIEMVCREQDNIKGLCDLLFWGTCALRPAVVPSRGTEKKKIKHFKGMVA